MEKAFRFLEKANATIIFIAGIGFILISFYIGWHVWHDIFRAQKAHNVVNVIENEAIDESFSFGYPIKLEKTPNLIIPLISNQSSPISKYEMKENARNLLFVDIKKNESRWLFEDANKLILDYEVLFHRDKKEFDKTLGVFCHIIKKDSDNNGKLSDKDLGIIALVNIDGENYLEITDKVQRVYSVSIVDENLIGIVFKKDNSARLARISLPDFKLISETKLPKMQANP